MSSVRSLSAINGYLAAHSQRRTQASDEQRTGARRFITLSRQAGAGARTVGKLIVELLNQRPHDAPWTLFDRELLDAVLEQHDLPRELSRYMPEDTKNTFTDTLESILGLHPSTDALIRKMNETILTLAQLGNAIIVGRGANVLTRNLNTGIHVRLIASEDSRLRTIGALHGLDERGATDRMRRIDAGRKRYVQDRFRVDVDDPSHYDLVINTTWLSHQAAAEIIAAHILRTSPRRR